MGEHNIRNGAIIIRSGKRHFYWGDQFWGNWDKAMRWFADNSELIGARGTEIPDMLFFGGIIVSPDMETELNKRIKAIKSKYGPIRAPIKWNFKDLKLHYEKLDKAELYSKLLASSKEWRTEIFESVKDIEFTIVIAFVQSHSIKTTTIRGVKPDLTRYVFSNGLMRVALHAKETKSDECEIVLDWPDKSDPKPFNEEYESAYNSGCTSEGNVPYHSGPLKLLGFRDSVLFTPMLRCAPLQFADLVLGACREFIECSIGKKETGFGADLTKIIARRYRGYKGNIYGRGISVASGDSAFKAKVKTYINTELA